MCMFHISRYNSILFEPIGTFPTSIINAVPEYSWKTADTSVNVSEEDTAMQLEVPIIRSSLIDPKFCNGVCPCVKFRLLNESIGSK